ncbi:transglutaminase family protein [Lachnospiraceae bacterium JLR.KK008]
MRIKQEGRKHEKDEWGTVKRMLALTASVCMFAGSCMTAAARQIVWDANMKGTVCVEDDGSFVVNEWVQSDWGEWFYFGADGLAFVWNCKEPCPIATWPDGTLYADKRIRSASGQPGQQPVFSVPSTQRDIRYQGLRQMLDSIPLYPDATSGIPEFDAMLDNIFAQIITPDMDTHDKLKACHDYIVLHMKDERYEEVGDWEDVSISDNPDIPTTYVEAYAALHSGIGVCDTYSAIFAAMAWRLGVPMYMVSGAVTTGGGGYTPHVWCQLDGPDGTVYVFDPHIDYLTTLRGNGTVSNARFGPTQAQMAGKYTKMEALFDYQ